MTGEEMSGKYFVADVEGAVNVDGISLELSEA